MYVSRIFGHVSRYEIHKALQFKDLLPSTPIKMYLLVSKSGLVDGLHAHLRITPTGRLDDAVAYSLLHCPAAAHIGE